jgi:hypothetical protein
MCTDATAFKLAAAVSTQTAVSRTSESVVQGGTTTTNLYGGGVPSISVYGVPKEARLSTVRQVGPPRLRRHTIQSLHTPWHPPCFPHAGLGSRAAPQSAGVKCFGGRAWGLTVGVPDIWRRFRRLGACRVRAGQHCDVIL